MGNRFDTDFSNLYMNAQCMDNMVVCIKLLLDYVKLDVLVMGEMWLQPEEE